MLALLSLTAVAQVSPPEGAEELDVPDAATPAALEAAPAATPVVALPLDLSAGFRWAPAGPDAEEQLSDVALHHDRPDTWAVAGLDGEVWLTEDAGRSWRSILPALAVSSADEDVILAVQARIQELTSQIDEPAESAYEDNGYVDEEGLAAAVEEAGEQARALAAQAMAEIQSEIEAGAWFLEQQAVMGGDRDRARPRVVFTASGLLVAARADGLRVTADLGGSWDVVLDATVTAFVETSDGAFVVGFVDGLGTSADLRGWERVPSFNGVRVTDLVVDGGLWVTTTEGAWSGLAGTVAAWRRVEPWVGGVYTTRPASLDGGLLLAAEDTVHRTSDPFAERATPAAGGPVPRVTSLARHDGGGVLAASAEGPWQSVDQGRTWTALSLGSGDLEARDVEVRGDLVLFASAGGLLRLERRTDEPDEGPAVALPYWVPLGALVDATTRRPELTARVGRRWVAAMLPELALDGVWNQDVSDDWDADTWTLRSVDTYWQVRTQLTWRPGRQRTSSSFDAIDDFVGDVTVLMVDGDVVVDDGTSNAIMGNAVRRGATQYTTELAQTVSDLWSTRQRLVTDEERDRRGELVEKIHRRLRILEVEARLDALTGGAVSAWDSTSGGS